MVINENNSHLSSFVKGMNSDTSYDQVSNQQYVFGKNIRITKNNLLKGDINDTNYSSVHEGVVTPVPSGKEVFMSSDMFSLTKERYLGSDSIGDIGVIITLEEVQTDEDTTLTLLNVYKTTIDTKTNEVSKPTEWWSGDVSEKSEEFATIEAVSTVTYHELEGVIKLYIATGVYPIIEIRLDNYDKNPDKKRYTDIQNVDYFINNRILPPYPVYIQNRIDGSLKTSQVQYTYRYYNKFGTTTQLAPLTNKIQVIDANRNKEIGNAEDTLTSVGFTLRIQHADEYKNYERLQIFRLSYIKPGEDAEVALIYDGEFNIQGKYFQFNDVGTTPLQELTMEEFAAMSGLVIIPKIIEQSQQYLFAANVKDDTILEDVVLPKKTTITTKSFKIKLSTNIDGAPTQSSENITFQEIIDYFRYRNINPNLAIDSYNNIFTSSLLRSLRRGETYEYGVVYYDKYGRRTNVLTLGECKVGEYSKNLPFNKSGTTLWANPIGAEFEIPVPKNSKTGEIVKDIVGCQIVRRSSKHIYQKTLLQVALARPIRQKLYTTNITNIADVRENNAEPNVPAKYSPYYPTGFLWSDYTRIWPGYQRLYIKADDPQEDVGGALQLLRHDEQLQWNDEEITKVQHKGTDYFTAVSTKNDTLFQIFSSEIDFRRDDVLSTLSSDSTYLIPCSYVGLSHNDAYTTSYEKYNNAIQQYGYVYTEKAVMNVGDANIISQLPFITREKETNSSGVINIFRWDIKQDSSGKISEKCIFPLYTINSGNNGLTNTENNSTTAIKTIKDVKLPEWFDGFSNIQPDGSALAEGGIKKYQEFQTNIDNCQFNNWVSFGLYDHRITHNDTQPNVASGGQSAVSVQFLAVETARNRAIGFRMPAYSTKLEDYRLWLAEARGWIGPGSSCFVMTVNNTLGSSLFSGQGDTAICNIRHNITGGINEPDEFVQYFGFGNFFKLDPTYDENGELNGYIIPKPDGVNGTSNWEMRVRIFDGDIYITPHELTTMYKTYDFKSTDTLQSMQIVNYVPMESKVNTFFDYGMNYLNTNSANLLIEPGSIEGVTTQERPVHQYNQIYSANDESNDVFTLVVEKSEDNNFKQRTYYSEPKTNGEYVDNFVIFKPAAYIDVDGKYGEVTNLLTDKNILYYWQDHAFGKFSVNERSLINDQNGNTIMLGQAGILSRNDYISTKYGMRLYDFCATGAENGVYWVDINNRAIVAGNTNQAINYGEQLNVQNIINAKMDTYIPRTDYDLQNNELLCKCFVDDEQMIFNLKLNVATSIYNRKYDDILNIKNHLYGFTLALGKNKSLKIVKYNNLDSADECLTPLQLAFVVNSAASTTKVFDSQQIVPANRKPWNDVNKTETDGAAWTNKYLEEAQADITFRTDINNTDNAIAPYTDREGNIIYNIPRFGADDWGNRLRGKWMRCDFTAETPTEYTTISHIITKFRQSYS